MRTLVIAVAMAGLSACVSPSRNALANNDPYEAANRKIFALNQKIDSITLRRAAKAYNAYIPRPVRDSAHNALKNLDLPVTFVNDVLQGETTRAGQTVSRFTVNSTLGVGGFFDVASRIGIPDHSEDFGQTLAVWGIREGPYLVLPLLGPAPPRDAVGRTADVFFDPGIYVSMKQHPWWMAGRTYLTFLDLRARNIDALDDIERDSLDFYATTRSLYRQYRAKEVRNGGIEAPLPSEN